MAKWIAAKKARAGLRHAVVRPNVTGRTTQRIAQSKRARAGSLAIAEQSQVARTGTLEPFFVCRCHLFLSFRIFFAVFFCFVFVFPRPFVQSFFDKHACNSPESHTQLL